MAPKSLSNVFDWLGHNAKEDLRAHLDVWRTLASSKKNNVPAFFQVHDKINELRKRLDKLEAKSSEATPSSTSLSFNLEIQQASLPARFHMLIMTKIILTHSTTRWTYFRSHHEHDAGALLSH